MWVTIAALMNVRSFPWTKDKAQFVPLIVVTYGNEKRKDEKMEMLGLWLCAHRR